MSMPCIRCFGITLIARSGGTDLVEQVIVDVDSDAMVHLAMRHPSPIRVKDGGRTIPESRHAVCVIDARRDLVLIGAARPEVARIAARLPRKTPDLARGRNPLPGLLEFHFAAARDHFMACKRATCGNFTALCTLARELASRATRLHDDRAARVGSAGAVNDTLPRDGARIWPTLRSAAVAWWRCIPPRTVACFATMMSVTGPRPLPRT
ncbi:MAG: hypothetical protein AAF501_02820 [Pseudomonadota bacterium]